MDPLKEMLTAKKEKVKQLKKQEKAATNKTEKAMLGNKIKELEEYMNRFKPSVMEPKQIGDIVINYKLYQSFIKKLKGFFITEEVDEEKLVVSYYKGTNKGELVLLDLRGHFSSGSEFPKGQLQEASLI